MSTHRSSVLAAGTAALLAAGLAGCTADAAPPSAPSPTPVTVVALPSGDGQAPLEPGHYVFPVMDSNGWPELLPVVSVPAGYAATNDGQGVTIGADAQADGRMLRIWQIDSVYSHPCSTDQHALAVGPTTGDLAKALAAQPLRDGTDPVAVTIGGYDAFYVELSVPDGIDVDACPGGKFFSWPGRWQQAAGQVDMLWIVDVDGQRLVFDAWALPGADPQQRAELKQMVATAGFVATDDL